MGTTSYVMLLLFLSLLLFRVSTTPGNPGNLMEFKNLLEFNWSSWKFLCKMSKIDCIGFQSENWVSDRLFKKLNWSPYFIFATAQCYVKCISFFCSISRQTTSVHYIGGRSNANMSWIFLKIPPGISWKSPGNSLG